MGQFTFPQKRFEKYGHKNAIKGIEHKNKKDPLDFDTTLKKIF
jgi:hypothetical protein